jgi:predicted dehydrogenase
MGETHAHAYTSLEDAKVVAVCDIRSHHAEALASLLGCEAFTSYEEMNKKADYDVLDICLPTYLHSRYAIDAMKSGKHVFCEKPIALTLEDANRMVETAEENKVTFSVGHVLRFFPQYQTAADQIKACRIGTPALLRTTRNQAFPGWSWENWYQDLAKSGGPEVDLAIHDYDWLLCNFGPVTRVYAKNLGPKHPEQMHTLAILRFASGAMAHVEASWALPKGIEFRTTFELVGTDGQLCYDSSRDCPLKTQLGSDEEVSLFYDNPLSEEMNPYRAELAAFLHAVVHKTEPVVTAAEAIAALHIALAAKESARSGKVVRL